MSKPLIIERLKPRKCQVKDCGRNGSIWLPYKGKRIFVCAVCDAVIGNAIAARMKGKGKHTN